MNLIPFDPAGLTARKQSYFTFARHQASQVFKADGTFQPTTENDGRIPYWLYAALVSAPDPAQQEFANVIYAAAPSWNEFNVFQTSAIAANLARERSHMRRELIQRSEEHLARFAISAGGREPCAGCNDYVFHGYNDNMPAMAVRTLILTGDLLDRRDCTDRGLFHLEALCAHFERRGLLSEYTSGTYTPITLTALMDVAECSTNPAAREMAVACANRIALDLFGHWHPHVGGLGAAQARAYTTDKQEWLSVLNAWLWYLTGSPLCVNPLAALGNLDTFPGAAHHGRNFGFNLAQFAEMFAPAYTDITPALREFCAAPRAYPYEMRGTTDAGQTGLFGGTREIQTRAFHQPLYGLGTASETWFEQSGQQLTLHAVWSARATPQTWGDRVSLWHQTVAGELDQGAGAPAEVDHVNDTGRYHVLQNRGSALVLGAVAPAVTGQPVSQLKFSVVFNTRLRLPEEEVAEGGWFFLRFGEVYLGVRMSAMVAEQRRQPRRVLKNGYLRIEANLIESPATTVTHEFREWCDFGYVFEIASQAECGSFAEFRRQCAAGRWEFYHSAYRTSRYCGRHGELQIVDSVAAGTVRFMAVDGVVEPRVKLAATGLDPQLTELFPDGRRIRQRRLMFRPDFIGSPFYQLRSHILEAD